MITKYLEPDEVAKIAKCMKGDLRRIWLLMNGTGLRVSDAVKVKYGDIDEKGNLHYISQKTGKKGIIRVPGEVLAVIGNGNDNEFIFKSKKNPSKHIHRSTVFRHIKKACEKANISADGVACHTARKNFAVADFRENGLGKTMHDLLHRDASTTLFYALSDNPIPRIYAEIKIIKQSLDMHFELIENLTEICDRLTERITDVDEPVCVRLIDQKKAGE